MPCFSVFRPTTIPHQCTHSLPIDGLNDHEEKKHPGRRAWHHRPPTRMRKRKGRTIPALHVDTVGAGFVGHPRQQNTERPNELHLQLALVVVEESCVTGNSDRPIETVGILPASHRHRWWVRVRVSRTANDGCTHRAAYCTQCKRECVCVCSKGK